MKRKLTNQESKLCRQGINNRKITIKELELELSYFTEFTNFNEKWAKYLENKDKISKQKKKIIITDTIKYLKESIDEENRLILIEKNQLVNGVEIKKKPVGVD